MIAFKGTSGFKNLSIFSFISKTTEIEMNQGDSEHVRAQKLLDDIPIDPF